MKIKVNVFGWRLEFRFLFQLNKNVNLGLNHTIPQTTKIDAYVKHHNDISTPHYVILLLFIIISSKNYSTKQDTKYLLQSRVPSLTHGGLHVNNVSTSKRRQYFYHLEKCFFGSFWVSFILIQISFFQVLRIHFLNRIRLCMKLQWICWKTTTDYKSFEHSNQSFHKYFEISHINYIRCIMN